MTASREPSSAARAVRAAAGIALALACLLAPTVSFARGEPASRAEVSASALPQQAQEVLVRIRAGGPFAYSRDGIVFGNREHELPAQKRGYYHEYTVQTPGAHDRGARRVICGGPKRNPDACWYTSDHYASFRRIRE